MAATLATDGSTWSSTTSTPTTRARRLPAPAYSGNPTTTATATADTAPATSKEISGASAPAQFHSTGRSPPSPPGHPQLPQPVGQPHQVAPERALAALGVAADPYPLGSARGRPDRLSRRRKLHARHDRHRRGPEDGSAPAVEPPRLFAYRWARHPDTPVTEGTATRVEFSLTPEGNRTRLRVAESGFTSTDAVKVDQQRHAEANSQGWLQVLDSLQRYAEQRTA